MRVGLLSLFPLLATAEAPVHLTLQQAIEVALHRNPSMNVAREMVNRAEARVRQARAGYYPQVGFNGIAKAGLSGATNALSLAGLPASPFFRNFADSVNASQSIFDFGRTKHQMAFERDLRDAAEADYSVQVAQVTLEVKRAFFGLLRAQGLRDVAEEIVRAREGTARQAQALYEGELRSRVDLDLARANLARAQLQVTSAVNQVQAATTKLGLALGGAQDGGYVLELPDSETPRLGPLDSLIEESLRTRQELQSLHFKHDAAKERLEYVRSLKKPLLNLVFSGGYARFTDVLARQLLAGGAGLVLPLFTGGRIEGQEEEAQAELRAADSREETLKQQITAEVRMAWYAFENASSAVPVAQVQVEYARSAARLADERYRERLGSFVELNAAQSQLAEALANQSIGLYAVRIAEAELFRAIGRN